MGLPVSVQWHSSSYAQNAYHVARLLRPENSASGSVVNLLVLRSLAGLGDRTSSGSGRLWVFKMLKKVLGSEGMQRTRAKVGVDHPRQTTPYSSGMTGTPIDDFGLK